MQMKYSEKAGERYSTEDNEAYLEAAGGIRKDGSVYGIGSLSQFYYPLPDLRKTSRELPPSTIVLQLEDKLENTLQELKDTQQKFEDYKKAKEQESTEFKDLILGFKNEMARMSEALHCSDFSIQTPEYRPH